MYRMLWEYDNVRYVSWVIILNLGMMFDCVYVVCVFVIVLGSKVIVFILRKSME